MRQIKTQVYTFLNELVCEADVPVAGHLNGFCIGKLEFSGTVEYVDNKTVYEHRCTKCTSTKNLNVKYPSVSYEPIGE